MCMNLLWVLSGVRALSGRHQTSPYGWGDPGGLCSPQGVLRCWETPDLIPWQGRPWRSLFHHGEFCSHLYLLNHVCVFISYVCRVVAGHKDTFSAADPEVDISKDDKHIPMAANLSVRNLSGPHFILGHQWCPVDSSICSCWNQTHRDLVAQPVSHYC